MFEEWELPDRLPTVPGYRGRDLLRQSGGQVTFSAVRAGTTDLVWVTVFSSPGLEAPARQECQDLFERIRQLAQIPGLVATTEADFCPDGSPYLVTECVGGGDLAEQVRLGHQFTTEDIDSIAAFLRQAVGEIHQSGQVHGEVSAQNVAATESGELRLIGAGQNQIWEVIDPGADRIVRTPFTAPEIWQGEVQSPAADVYSIASTLYYLVTGELPYDTDESDGPAQIWQKHIGEAIKPITSYSVDQELANWIVAGLAYEPSRRPKLKQSLPESGGATPSGREVFATEADQTESLPGVGSGSTVPAARITGKLALAGVVAFVTLFLAGYGAIHLFASAPQPESTEVLPPTDLVAREIDGVVYVDWADPTEGRYPWVVAAQASHGANPQIVTPTAEDQLAATATVVPGLPPGAEYCFRAGLAVGLDAHNPVVWSDESSCINSAQPPVGWPPDNRV